ncbi:MAG: TRAP transporter small permease [Planctomycetota bacterium]|nr:TRAP transporter small permease [Planctomycetota bacterium]
MIAPPDRVLTRVDAAMRTARAIADKGIGTMLALLMGVAVLNVLWQVFTRFMLSDPSSFTEEAARYLLVWISVLGAGYAVGGGMHLAIDLLPSAVAGRRGAVVIMLLIDGCVVLFALAVLVIGGMKLVATTISQGETSPALGIRVGYVYIALPLAGAIMIFYAFLDALERLTSRGGDHKGGTDPPH